MDKNTMTRGRAIGFVLLALGVVLLFAPASTFGQVNNWMSASLAQAVNAAPWRAGPFRASAAFRLDNVGYDSDIYYGFAMETVPDYRFTAGLDTRLLVMLKDKVVLDFTERPEYQFYLHTQNERAWNNAFRGQVHVALQRFYLQAGAGLSNIRERMSPELNINIRRKEDNVLGLAFWQVSREASMALQFRGFIFQFQNPAGGEYNVRENLNRREGYFNFRAYLQKVARTRFYLDAEYGIFTFTEPSSSLRDSRSYSAYAGVEFLPPAGDEGRTRGVHGRLNIGYRKFDMNDSWRGNFAGLVGNTGVSITVLRRTAIRGYAGRDLQFSAFSDYTYYLQSFFGTGLSRYFSRRTLFTYDFFYSVIKYPWYTGGGTSSDQADFRAHSLRLLFRPGRNFELGIMALLTNRGEGMYIPGGKRYYIGLNFVYGTPSAETPFLANPNSQF
jgi:hypothetical protein